MLEQTYQFSTSNGEVRFSREWITGPSGRAIVVIIHGLADHSGRFGPVAELLNRHEIMVFAFDLEGNGRSPGRRGHFSSLGKVWMEMYDYINMLKGRFPGIPVFLYGQSMGGNLVLNFALRYPETVNGIVASSPWIRLARPPSKCLMRVGRILSLLFPSIQKANGVKGIDLSHDPETGTRYHADPLVHGKISLRTFFLISDSGQYLLNHAGELKIPLLLMHGTADQITSFQSSRDFFYHLYNSARQPSRSSIHQFIPWPGLLHELHNEPEKEQVVEAVAKWIKK